jgi:signal transduction histidine kinase
MDKNLQSPPPDAVLQVDEDAARDFTRRGGDDTGSWKILIIDDESEVHEATKFALSGLRVHGRDLAFLHAQSEEEARRQLARNQDVAVILLDMVMEAGDSGLRLVKCIREELKLEAVRIVLRTGQRGPVPELDVIQKYDINDYKNKVELTRIRLATTITAAVRSFQQIRTISDLNASLEQRVRERTAELQRVNRELESFSYSVAHDLRAPLRHIAGFGAYLQKAAEATLTADSVKYLEKIIQSASRMDQIIVDLLEFTRVGRAPLTKTPIDLGDLVKDVVHELRPEPGGRTIAWRIAALPRVRADKSLLRQVMANLISNAIKYTGKNAGAVEIEIGVSPAQDGGDPVVYVRDNGDGFEMEYAAKLFQPFSRLHRTSEFEGTGIGLSIVSSIVERHGGKVWAQAQKGHGATFYISLPA